MSKRYRAPVTARRAGELTGVIRAGKNYHSQNMCLPCCNTGKRNATHIMKNKGCNITSGFAEMFHKEKRAASPGFPYSFL